MNQQTKCLYYFESGKIVTSLRQEEIVLSIDYTDELSYPIFYGKKETLHRLDGPAVKYQGGYQAYYLHGIRHRLDGPAVIHPQVNKNFYFLFGVRYLQKEYKNQLKNLDQIIAFYLLCQDPFLRKVAETSHKLLSNKDLDSNGIQSTDNR